MKIFKSISILFTISIMILFVSSVCAQTMEHNTDRPGMDYKSFEPSFDDPKTCEDACKEDFINCKAFTYVKIGVKGIKGRCYLKSGVPTPVTTRCCISGVMPPPQIQPGKGFAGITTSRPSPTQKIELAWTPGFWVQLKNKFEANYSTYQGDVKKFETALELYNQQVNVCMNKSFTLQEQQNAGCLPNDTWGQCSDKVLKQCVGAKSGDLQAAKTQLQNDFELMMNSILQLTDMLKKLQIK